MGHPAAVNAVNIPNLITIARILLVPFTVWLIISGAYGFAFAAFLAAGISDGIDGYIARRFELRTELGALLDPIADKALMVSIFVALGLLKVVPAWLVILVVSRDVLIVGAVMLSWGLDKPIRMKPMMVSKVNTVAQIAFLAIVLGVLTFDLHIESINTIGLAVVALLTAASGALYLRQWLRHMAGPNGDRLGP
jgi:cardiolipin synthase (CMP-forming)